MKFEEQKDLGFQIAKYVIALILIFLFFSRIVRPVFHWMTTSAEVVEEKGLLPTAEELAIEEEKKRLAMLGTQAHDLRAAVTEFVKSDPKFTAGILRRWMKDRTS